MSDQTPKLDGIEVVHGWNTPEYAGGTERRVYLRYPLEIEGQVEFEPEWLWDCKIVDFSAHGMRLVYAPPGGPVGTADSSQQPESAERPSNPAAAVVAGDAQPLPEIVKPGAMVKLLIALPGSRRRIRAKARVRRLLKRENSVELGIQYSRINIEVFKSLLAASDSRRYRRVEELSPKDLAAAVSKPWQHTAYLLEGAVGDFFARAEERLRLHAESAADAATLGPFFYSLIELKNQHYDIASHFIRQVYNQIADEQASLERELDEYKAATMELPELDPSAPAYKWDLAHLASKPEPFSARLLNAEHSPLAPDALKQSFMEACEPITGEESVASILLEVAAEVAALEFTQLQRILRPIAWRDERQQQRRRRPSIDLAGTEFDSRL